MEEFNRQVTELLLFMGQLLEIQGEDPFKVRAYYRAAEQVTRLDRSLSEMTKDEIEQIQGIGEKIARKILEIHSTGTFQELEERKAMVPSTLIELLHLEGVGPKTISKLWKQMGIQSISDLEKAARGHRIRALKGFGEKKEQDMLRSIQRFREQGLRMNRLQADQVVACVASALPPGSFEVAGSYRRGKSTVGDIDVVTTTPPSIANPRLRQVAEEMIDEGDRKTSLRCQGQRVDVRFTRPEEYGSMLLYLTGSKEFNIRLREIALAKGWRLNEYGIEDRTGRSLQIFSTEEEIFSVLGMDSISPEIRENQGEIERAIAHSLPKLLTLDALRGDLHVHSSWSDGHLSLDELAKEGEKRGYQYLLISDHSASLGITRGLDAERVQQQIKEIERVNRSSSCRLLAGIEVDILSDGTLALPPSALEDLDLVIGSVHSGFKQERDVMTRRILSALESESLDILGHPTGRLIGERPPYEVDLGRVIKKAAETGTALEINASPHRLDLDDLPIKRAKEQGVRLAIGTDAHAGAELACIRYGVMVARRGWCEGQDVLNTLEVNTLLGWAQ
jgi:DNA polymerase (family 10)